MTQPARRETVGRCEESKPLTTRRAAPQTGVLGQVTGKITAAEKIDMRERSSVEGDIAAPRVVIAEGVHFRGSIDMPAPRSR